MPDDSAVLVLDGRQRAALAAVRSLARHGLRVHAAEQRGLVSLTAASRACRGSVELVSEAVHPARFVDEVLAAADRAGCRWVMPVTDVSTMLLCADRRFEGRLLAANGDAYEAVSNKQRLHARAAALGVAIPRTVVAEGAAAVAEAATAMGFPCIAKPARSKYIAEGRVRESTVKILPDASTMARILASAEWVEHLPTLVQEYVPGHGQGVFCLFDGREARAWFAHRRLREKPPSGGVSVLSAGAAPDERLEAHATQLLRDAGYRGIAMVEFRVAPDGTAYLMEINGRPWGSMQLAIDAGIDFPWLLYCLCSGQPLPQVHPHSARLRWFMGDVDHLLMQLKQPTGGRGRARSLLDFLATTFDPRVRNEVLRLGDPMPALIEFAAWLRRQ